MIMVAIGNFFFKYRNWIFILFYAALFIPSWPLFSKSLGEHYYYWPIVLGLLITILGQFIRGFTIGLAYIVRGGKEGKPYAEGLITEGIFNHCRNPLYVGNIFMLLGIGILDNSLIYVLAVVPAGRDSGRRWRRPEVWFARRGRPPGRAVVPPAASSPRGRGRR